MGVTGHKNKHAKAPIDTADAKTRTCLRCDKSFESNSRANRICPRCRGLKGRS
ncbi:MAG: hypothetical protein ABFD92_11110 [Planctomycetaceae bacterium]|nr:hypothetical protein [Planctomycetaceae bacterium]